MTDQTNSSPKKIVLAPDLIGRSFFDPAGLQVMELWRDQRLMPVVNRDLALRYLRLLRALGLETDLTRRWLWWFTAADKSHYLKDLTLPGLNGIQLCTELARRAGAESVVCGIARSDSQSGPLSGLAPANWILAEDFIVQFNR